MSTKKNKESKYLNATPIEKLLEDAKIELGSLDVIEPTRIFKRNWVDTVRDLRLLHKENELKTLVRINDQLLTWLSSESKKGSLEGMDAATNNYTVCNAAKSTVNVFYCFYKNISGVRVRSDETVYNENQETVIILLQT